MVCHNNFWSKIAFLCWFLSFCFPAVNNIWWHFVLFAIKFLRVPGVLRSSETSLEKSLGKDLWIYGQNTQIAKYIVGGLKNPYSFTDTQYFLDVFIKVFSYAYKWWGHDSIWYFSCLYRKFSELRALLFQSSTQTSQNLKFIHVWAA